MFTGQTVIFTVEQDDVHAYRRRMFAKKTCQLEENSDTAAAIVSAQYRFILPVLILIGPGAGIPVCSQQNPIPIFNIERSEERRVGNGWRRRGGEEEG